ncbi:cytidylyltransferase domain-containing protein [Candidatus Omnitrophota bacterium]
MADKLKKGAIVIQARMSSSRFPQKMMAKLGGMPLIKFVYRRCKTSNINRVCVATSEDSSDDKLYDYCKKNNYTVVRGSLDNVLERYLKAAEYVGADYLVRVGGDTPFVDIDLAEEFLKTVITEGLDYVSVDRVKCASAFYSEAVSRQALQKASDLTFNREDLEHVTRFIIKNSHHFNIRLLDKDLNRDFMKDFNLTIDYPDDIERARHVAGELKDKFKFKSKDILDIVENHITTQYQ